MSSVHHGRLVVCCDLSLSCRLRAFTTSSEAGHLYSSQDSFFILSHCLGVCTLTFDQQIEDVLIPQALLHVYDGLSHSCGHLLQQLSGETLTLEVQVVPLQDPSPPRLCLPVYSVCVSVTPFVL